uniref:autotransporter outer membrane beta-barrel domain-containing protein n=1 Tax=Variovorax sp. dw_308 TaxID=2721546 RepID=UPI001C441309
VGGSAGAGGNGGSATVTNKGTIVTNGADSDGILVQSVGGGGGLAGKGSSTAGTAATPGQTAAALLSSVTNGLGVGKGVTPIADKVFKVGDGILADVNNVKEVQKALGVGGDSSDGTLSVAATGDDNDSGIAKGIQLGLTVGGKGGGGGSGGTAGASNAGNILTAGSRADGIMVQSIGGGGGVGGATTFSGTLGQNSTGNASLALGANGANGGAAGTVTAANAAGASIITSGIMAHGMVGQSIGGGGGDAGIQGNTGGALANLSVVVGGSGGASGAGGAVTLDNEGAVQTQGSYASGMVAQSVGGGGGTATVLSSNAVTASIGSMQLSLGGRGGKASDGGAVTVNSAQTGSGLALLETQGQGSVGVLAQSIGGGGGSLQVSDGTTGTLPGTLTLPLTLGGGDGASGNGGAVTVNLGSASKSALISTGGQDAHGVVVQSIGGGGGLVAGASNTPGALATLFGAGAHQGNGGAVALNLQSANVNTSGDGATALFAQSIGGGGGLFGALSQFTPGSTIQSTPVSTSGQGGNVNVNLNGADITTYAARAHGVWAQAFGGGGGVMGSSDGTGVTFAGASPYAGCSGSACTGAINVALTNGASINVNGPQSYGVYVQSRGNGVNDTTISLDSTSAIETSDPTGIAIFVDGAGTNTIKNSGVIVANEGNGVALAGNQPANLINDTNSTFSGSIKLPKGNSAFSNMPGATFNAGDTVDLGAGGLLSNAGTLTVGGAHMAQTNVHGQLQQTASGRTVIDVDTVGRRNDSLVVDGSASLAGTVLLHPTTLSPTSFNVLSASGSLTTDPALRVQDGGGNLLFGYGTTVSGNGGAAAAGGLSKPDAGGATLSVTPYSKLGTAAVQGGLGANRNALAMHLDAGFGGGTTPAQGAVYAQLATLGSLPAYSNALDNLSGELLQSANITRVASSVTLAERMNTAHCAGRGDMGELAPEADCNWARVTESRTSRDGTADEAGFGMSNSALQAGAQRRIAEGWFAGGAVSYDNTRLHANGVDQSVDGSSGSVAGVLKYQTGPWTFSGSADLGYGSYDSTRHIAFAQTVAQAKGDFHMWHAGVHGRIAYAMPMDGFYLRPYLDLHAVRVQTSDNRETGAGALDLQASGGGQNFFAASPMLEIGTPDMKLGGMEVRGYAAIGATLSKESQASGQARLEGWAAAPGVQPFQVNSSIPERRGRVELGATLLLGHGQELTLSYGGEFAGGFRSNSGTVKYRYVF